MFTSQSILAFANHSAAITADREIITYQDIYDFSEKLYAYIEKRCLVFCLCSNKPGSLYGYVSFIIKKIVPLMLDASLDRELLSALIDTYKPEFLWMPSERLGDFNDFQVVFTESGYALIKRKEDHPFPLHDELALLFTTSGSTGSPRLVRISYTNLASNAESIAEYLSINENERAVTVLPMHYSYGLSVINSHLLRGATLLLTDKSLMEKEFWSLVKEEKATSFSGVPYTYEILKKLRFERMDLPSVTTLTQAGGKLSETLCVEFAEICRKTGKRFFIMYGQTEATARISYLPPEYALSKPGSIGKAIPGGKLELKDSSGNTIENAHETGELVYRGKNVSLGYAQNGPDLAKQDENQGVLHTNDLATRDEDGFYYITGRKNRFVKLFGNRVSLDEIEQMVKKIDLECACVGRDDKLFIYITQSGRETEVCEYISSVTGINRIAFAVTYISSIPKNSSGKILYPSLSVA